MTKHDAMEQFFRPVIIELCGSVLNFNYSQEEPDAVALITNYSDKVRKKYVRAAEKEYGFSIVITKPFSSYGDNLNLEAMNFVQAFMDWLETQNRKKIYPAFPDNCQIKKMEVLQNMPNLAGINDEEQLARYMVQCRLIYFEKEA